MRLRPERNRKMLERGGTLHVEKPAFGWEGNVSSRFAICLSRKLTNLEAKI